MKRIVTIGGGTGSFTLLSGLKNYPFDITAVVTMADDGGSTGLLRDEMGVLPPGDVRQCLVALSDSSEALRALMNYRFENGGLEGHSFGNLMLGALEKITGSFSSGVDEAARILNVRGHVVPVSESDMRLEITLENGKVMQGEKELDENSEIRRVGIKDIALAGRVRANAVAVAAIEEADVVVIGPGDHFGSIMPNLLVSGIAKAIKKSRAKVIFVAPLTNKKGHTSHFSVEDYVCALEERIGKERVNYVVYNTKKPSADALARYEEMEGEDSLVRLAHKIDCQSSGRAFEIVQGDFLKRAGAVRATKGDAIAATRSFIRHDSDALARAVAFVVEQGENKIEIV